MQNLSPVSQRTLVTVNPKDPVRWQQRVIGMEPFVNPNGTGWGNDYRDIVTLGDVRDAPLDESWTLHSNRLLRALDLHGFDMSNVPPEHLKAISLALSGKYGQQVSLVGLDPQLVQAMQGIQHQFPELGNGLNLYEVEGNKHAYHFLEGDNMLEPTAFGIGGDAIAQAPQVGDLTEQEYAQSERQLRETLNRTKGIEVEDDTPTPQPKTKKKSIFSKLGKSKDKEPKPESKKVKLKKGKKRDGIILD
jgi:hypothetical protein